MILVWKLLRQHISLGQFAGFFFANICGMMIVLFGYQFYNDVLPVFTQEDSFMKADYMVVSKKIGMGTTNTFSQQEEQELKEQTFTERVGHITSTEYKSEATMGVQGQTILNSEMYFESVPDAFVDVPLSEWKYVEGEKTVPVIIPRTYINMYNFGFAKSHDVPVIGDGMVNLIDFKIYVHTKEGRDEYKGKVIGFSNKISSIIVPEAFMRWSNSYYMPNQTTPPNRLLLEVKNPSDDAIQTYLQNHGFEIEKDKLDAEKTTYFLKMMVIIVMTIGGLISALSFYILMLSIYLLVQKNADKLQNLLLIGYSSTTVALPYQLLTMVLNIVVLMVAVIGVVVARNWYLDFVYAIYPELQIGGIFATVILGLAIFAVVSIVNMVIIRKKIISVFYIK